MPRVEPKDPKWLTVAEYARLMRVHRETIYRQVRAGKLGAFRVGGQWRVPAPGVPYPTRPTIDVFEEVRRRMMDARTREA